MDPNLIKFCRCCLSRDGDLTSMSTEPIQTKHDDNDTKCTSFYDGYLICSGLSYDEFSLTKNICLCCSEKLKSSYTFSMQCRKSNEVLRENYGMLPEIKEEKPDDEPIDFIIYNDSLPEANHFVQVFVNDSLTKKVIETESLNTVASFPIEDDVCDINMQNDIDNDEKDDKTGVVDMEEPEKKKKRRENKSKDFKVAFNKKKLKRLRSSSKPLPQMEPDDPAIQSLTPYDVDEFVKKWEKGQYICFFCDEFTDSYLEYVEHRRKTHTFDAGMVKVERICNLCSTQTTGYVSHLTAQHPNYKPNKCRICDKTFKHQLELRSHLYNHINLDYKCLATGCAFTSKNQKALRAHISATQHSNSYHCPYCGIGFLKFHECVDHTKELHNKDSLFPCTKCKGVSLTKNDFDLHKCGKEVLNQNEIDEMKQQVVIICEICNRTFHVREHFEIHLLTMCDGKEKYFCEVCVKMFQTRKQLYHHNRLHVDRNYQCDECGFCTTIESMLKKHKIMHRDDRPYACSKCSSAFKRKSELVRHQETHNEQMFECFLCDKKFRSSLGIKTHMSSHLPEMKKFPCLVCGKKFSTGHDRNRHAKIHTDAPPKKKPSTKEHPCNICGKVFYNSHDKNKHVKVHAGRTIKCELCPADFHSSNCLNTHLKEKHGAESFYECKFCGKVLPDAIKMKKHIYIHDEFRKPYQCTSCLYDFVKRDRFKTHLMRCHSIEYDDAVHGYKEVPNMNDIVTECLKVKYPDSIVNAVPPLDTSMTTSFPDSLSLSIL